MPNYLSNLFNKKFTNEWEKRQYESQMQKKYPQEYAEWKRQYNSLQNGYYTNASSETLDKLFEFSGITVNKDSNK